MLGALLGGVMRRVVLLATVFAGISAVSSAQSPRSTQPAQPTQPTQPTQSTQSTQPTQSTRTFAVPLDSTGAVRIHALAGSVTVHVWDRDSVHITAVAPPWAIMRAGGTRSAFKLSTYDGIPDSIAPVRLDIRVPRRAQLWIKASSASLAVHDVAGSVDLYTMEGDVRATGTPDELRIETMRGRVHVSGQPTWLRVRTGTSDITFDGEAMDLALSTVSGTVTSPAASGRSRIETVRGDVTVTRLPLRGAPLEVDTHSGQVEIVASRGADAAFTVFSATGAITNRLSEAKPGKPGKTGAELAFTLGSGASRVTIRSFSGGVRLGR